MRGITYPELCFNHSFHLDVTTTLTTLVIAGISDHSSLLDSYVVLYAAFVGALHKLIGIEFGMFSQNNTTEIPLSHYPKLPISCKLSLLRMNGIMSLFKIP